jgi:hypothetical protein
MLCFFICNAPRAGPPRGRARGIHSGETLFVRGADCSVRAPAHILLRAVTGVCAHSLEFAATDLMESD